MTVLGLALAQGLSDLALDPSVTEGPAIIIFGVLALFALIGIRYRSPLVMVSWFGMVLALILTILINVRFVSFWVAGIVTAGVIVLATVLRWVRGGAGV